MLKLDATLLKRMLKYCSNKHLYCSDTAHKIIIVLFVGRTTTTVITTKINT